MFVSKANCKSVHLLNVFNNVCNILENKVNNHASFCGGNE